jgi:hypothetical protein
MKTQASSQGCQNSGFSPESPDFLFVLRISGFTYKISGFLIAKREKKYDIDFVDWQFFYRACLLFESGTNNHASSA